MRAFFGIIFVCIGLTSQLSHAGLHSFPTNPTCSQPLKPIYYSAGVTRFLADYYILVVENSSIKYDFRTVPTRLAFERVEMIRMIDRDVYYNHNGTINFTVVFKDGESVGTLNWDRDHDEDFLNMNFQCGNAGNIYFEINTRSEARLSVGN